MANAGDDAIRATLAALAAMLHEGLSKTEQARHFSDSGDDNAAFSRLIEADRFIAETVSLRQAAMTMLRNNAVLKGSGGPYAARAP